MSSGIFKVIGIFQDNKGNPLWGDKYKVKLFDRDPLADDFLSEAKLDENGHAEFIIFAADILSMDSPGEKTPDLFFVVEKENKVVFESATLKNVDFETMKHGYQQELTKSFGPFIVDSDQ